MKIYEINDKELKRNVGCLLYFEKEKSYVIELAENLDEWTAPLLFSQQVKLNRLTIYRELSRRWVQERVIPSGRQNISSILANAKLASYDEMRILEQSKGRCSQDQMYISKVDKLPDYVVQRRKHNLVDCVLSEPHSLLCFFVDGAVRKVTLDDLKGVSGVDKLIRNASLFQSGSIAAGGYFLTFDNAVDIPAEVLYHSGILIPLSMDDFLNFSRKNLLDSTEACDLLECTRQNLSYYVSQGILSPVKKDVKGNLYRKGNVLATRW